MRAAPLLRTGSLAAMADHPIRSPARSPIGAVSVAPRNPIPLRRARSEADLLLCHVAALAPAMVEEGTEHCGGGAGNGRRVGGGRGGGGGGDRYDGRRMSEHYREMLRIDPGNPLLLANYGKFLHQVAGDSRGAEEWYGRAVLASPNDGEVLSLYGKLVWETHRDEERAEAYFERAVEASPDNCYVMGSYAHFLWDAVQDEDDEEEDNGSMASSLLTVVEAF